MRNMCLLFSRRGPLALFFVNSSVWHSLWLVRCWGIAPSLHFDEIPGTAAEFFRCSFFLRCPSCPHQGFREAAAVVAHDFVLLTLDGIALLIYRYDFFRTCEEIYLA